jgi:hypothetical protein
LVHDPKALFINSLGDPAVVYALILLSNTTDGLSYHQIFIIGSALTCIAEVGIVDQPSHVKLDIDRVV